MATTTMTPAYHAHDDVYERAYVHADVDPREQRLEHALARPAMISILLSALGSAIVAVALVYLLS